MSTYPQEPPAAYHPDDTAARKAPVYDEKHGGNTNGSDTEGQYDVQEGEQGQLHRSLQGRHMQMIAIGEILGDEAHDVNFLTRLQGGAIGAGLFVGSGGSFRTGGPAAVVICFMIIGFFLLLTMQALAELGVMYPVNGAFFQYNIRFISRPWGFATGWDYAISWLTVLPFEITAAGLTIRYWQGAEDVNIGVWITVFLVVLAVIQIFGVRGYGEVEFVLSVIKILACTGFIILGIIINCGGVPTDDRGYIGGRYWNEPYSAFRNGFHGFCSVFVNAAYVNYY